MEPGEREENSVPDGWTVVTYTTRPNEYCYSNSVTGKDVRVRERPTEPPPMGLDLLRKPDNAWWCLGGTKPWAKAPPSLGGALAVPWRYLLLWWKLTTS